MKSTYWLVHYKQRRPGQKDWLEANAVTSAHPAEFLMNMKNRNADHESILTFAMEVPEQLAHIYLEAY